MTMSIFMNPSILRSLTIIAFVKLIRHTSLGEDSHLRLLSLLHLVRRNALRRSILYGAQ
jgi:hypothetical protein